MSKETATSRGIAWRNAVIRGYLFLWLIGAYPLFKIIEANNIWTGLFAVLAGHLVGIPSVWFWADMAVPPGE